MQFEEYKKEIEKNFPTVKVGKIEMAGEGWDSVAFFVNDDLVFRFGKNESTVKIFQREICFLPKLRKTLKFEIPNFQYVGKQKNGFPIVGYKKIEGINLTAEVLKNFSEQLYKRAVAGLAEFINQMHSVALSDAEGCGIEEVNLNKFYSRMLKSAEAEVFPKIKPENAAVYRGLFAEYLNNPSNFTFQPRVIHGDLSGDHIFLNPNNHEISGIIDFSDLSISDPAYELRYLLEEYGEKFLKDIIKHLGSADKTMEDRARFFEKTSTLAECVQAFGIKDKEKFEELIKWLNENTV